MSAEPPTQPSAAPPPQGPHSAGSPPIPGIPVPPGEPSEPAAAKEPRNKVGLVALIFGAVGFLFGAIPGALIVGWILLPIAFILGIVSLFQPGKKTTGIIAIVLSVVGTVASILVLVVGVGSAMEDSFGGGEVTVQTEESSEGEAAETDSEAADAHEEKASSDSQVGSRDNPAPLGATITGENWEVVVNEVIPDATEEVMAANPYNDEPDAGHQYLMVNLTATYTGEDASSDFEVGVAFVSADGRVFHTYDALVVAPDPTFGSTELYSGASSTGNDVISVPSGAEGLLRISPGMFADEVFVAFP